AAIGVLYLLTRDTTTKKTTATAPTTLAVPTTVAATFLPGPEGGSSTTVATFAPPTTVAPASAPATPATRAAPATTAAPADPKSEISFQLVRGFCSSNGQLSANATTANTNA